MPVFCFLLQFVGTNLEPNLNQIFLCVSFAFCCNLWDLNFILLILLFAAICSILDYTANYLKYLRALIVRKPYRACLILEFKLKKIRNMDYQTIKGYPIYLCTSKNSSGTYRKNVERLQAFLTTRFSNFSCKL